ncbi:MAG: peptide chain release factor 3 [Actinobacteria bacterium]|nr:peptide chain release factor 3 [Actinomycetota bacterium]
MSTTSSPALDPARAAARRRTFAIISHPDAGKTTLTEKFLLYSGAIHQAGAVRSRKVERTATSDWMALERQRGISISSAVVRFDHRGVTFNLLDTPGHRDFSEDTYRVLSAVDAAVMVLDAAKGVEHQTRKLFAVCRRRGTPLLTFVNKMDRPSLDPLAILDDIEAQIGLEPVPVTWPVKSRGQFHGVVDRRDRVVHRFARTAHGSTKAPERQQPWDGQDDPDGTVDEQLALLDAVHDPVDLAGFRDGRSTPVFFGSALSNFGVRLLLDALVDLAPAPQPRADVAGDPRPLDAPFSAYVFKVQANMDPRHRDRIAFLRICSGRFERGMTATCARTGQPFAMRYAHEVSGQGRATADVAWPGDVIGLVNASDLTIGDTLYVDEPVAFPSPPTFAPEHFRRIRPTDRTRYKQFRRGLSELDEEGVIQVLRDPQLGDQAPLLAAVGVLQFDVTIWRLEHEFGALAELDDVDYQLARRTDRAGARTLRDARAADVYHRSDGTPLALFRNRFALERLERDLPGLTLDAIVTL